MTKLVLNSNGIWENGFALVRFVTGIFLIVHGTQAFAAEDMKGYAQWLTDLHVPLPAQMAYIGKGTELLGGLCLALGLFTMVATVLLIITFCFVTFVMGHGKIFTEDQHPFLFVLLSLIFFFIGPGRWSLDHRIFNREK